MFKEYRIRKLKEYIAESDCEIETIETILKNATEMPAYYINRLIDARKIKAVFESRLSSITDKNGK